MAGGRLPKSAIGTAMRDDRFDGQVIPIIRKQTIGEIVIGPDGKENPLIAAFGIAASYIAEHDEDEGTELEFDLWGRTFHASIDPAPPRVENKDRNDNYPYTD